MHEVTAFIIAFIFVGIIFPKLVKNLPLFYGALGLVLLAILIDSVGSMFSSSFRFAYFFEGLLDIAAILMLVMGTGGQTLGQLAGEMGRSFEAVRSSAAPPTAPVTRPAPQAPTAAPAAAPAAPPVSAPAKPRSIAMPPRKTGDTSIPMD
ncbi:MAG TPA: hypothetical protein VFE47_08960 [Tepidisphaeraceae bacterium]|jgi:hypothetical protein|nr:hypothetical protein [Tepidisphaeraceae bacterium]